MLQVAASAPASKKQQLGSGQKSAGFSDHNAKWLKPKKQQQPAEEPSSEEEEEEEELSGEEFLSEDFSDGAPLWGAAFAAVPVMALAAACDAAPPVGAT